MVIYIILHFAAVELKCNPIVILFDGAEAHLETTYLIVNMLTVQVCIQYSNLTLNSIHFD